MISSGKLEAPGYISIVWLSVCQLIHQNINQSCYHTTDISRSACRSTCRTVNVYLGLLSIYKVVHGLTHLLINVRV